MDIITSTRINPEDNKIRIFNSYDEEHNDYSPWKIENWQRLTGSTVLVNSAQYLGKPTYGRPCALVIADGKRIGPRSNSAVRGMLVAEPIDVSLPCTDLLDFRYDEFDEETTNYTQEVQHWPILLNRERKITWSKKRTGR
ncbi:MAG: hypothetical protein KKB79_03325 [Nanoarchaeota archaeon]|nr:hypothetical protein [Nanoarchaeota archaeon]